MKLVADENVDRQIGDILRASGYEVLSVAELDPGIDDNAVLARSLQAGAVLLTADKDFGELAFRQRLVHGGILPIRLDGLTPDEKAALVVDALELHGNEMGSGFAVLSASSFRLRKTVQ